MRTSAGSNNRNLWKLFGKKSSGATKHSVSQYKRPGSDSTFFQLVFKVNTLGHYIHIKFHIDFNTFTKESVREGIYLKWNPMV